MTLNGEEIAISKTMHIHGISTTLVLGTEYNRILHLHREEKMLSKF